jgi:hypothetical protein
VNGHKFIFFKILLAVFIILISILPLWCVTRVHHGKLKFGYAALWLARMLWHRFLLLVSRILALGTDAIYMVGFFYLYRWFFLAWNTLRLRIRFILFFLYPDKILVCATTFFLEWFHTTHSCSFRFLFYNFKLVNWLKFLKVKLLLFFFLLLFSLWGLLNCLIFCILHDDEFLKILNFLTHTANHFILSLNF